MTSQSKPRGQRSAMHSRALLASSKRTSYLTMSPKLLVHFKLELAIAFCTLSIFSSVSAEVTVWTKAELNAGRDAALVRHNLYRCQHGAPPLKLDSELNQIAQAYAEKLVSKQATGHSHAPGLGENLAWSSTTSSDRQDATKHFEKAVDDWYNEIQDYNGRWSTDPVVGHFTQVVWKATTKVGLGIATAIRDQDGMTLQDVHVVANYKPRGNMNVQTDELQQNVQAEPGNANQCETNKDSNPSPPRPNSGSNSRSGNRDSSDSSPNNTSSTCQKKLSVFVGILSLSPFVFLPSQ